MSDDTQGEFRRVPIDFDVYKALTAQLTSPSDSFNGVIRRLLNLEEKAGGDALDTQPVGGWHVGGITIPNGTDFRAKYKGRYFSAKVESGALVYDRASYTSPSPAAIAITGGNVNGWRFWQCRLPGDQIWQVMDALRPRHA